MIISFNNLGVYVRIDSLVQLTLIGNWVNYTFKKKFNWCFCVLLKYNFNLDLVKSMSTLIYIYIYILYIYFFLVSSKKKRKRKKRQRFNLWSTFEVKDPVHKNAHHIHDKYSLYAVRNFFTNYSIKFLLQF